MVRTKPTTKVRVVRAKAPGAASMRFTSAAGRTLSGSAPTVQMHATTTVMASKNGAIAGALSQKKPR